MPQPFQLSRKKGWTKPAGGISVARPGVWGNPFIVGQPSGYYDDGKDPHIAALTLDQCLEFYGNLISGIVTPAMQPHARNWQKRFRKHFGAAHPSEVARSVLRGHDLGCWCGLPPIYELDRCHRHRLMEIANA